MLVLCHFLNPPYYNDIQFDITDVKRLLFHLLISIQFFGFI